MIKRDTALIAPFDCIAAVGLLSRLPVRVDMERATARGARSAWAYPVAGLVLGLLITLVAMILQFAGVPNVVTAGLCLAVLTVITGAMHEDGLADSLDGLWGGWDKARRLEIMKDSAIGAYGVIGLVLSLGLRWTCYWMLLESGEVWALVAVASLSRAAMVAVMAGLPNARATGLSHQVGRPTPHIAWIAVAIGFVICLMTLGTSTLLVVLVAIVTTTLWAATAHQKIGGQTGDILGATQQFVEMTMLVSLVSIA